MQQQQQQQQHHHHHQHQHQQQGWDMPMASSSSSSSSSFPPSYFHSLNPSPVSSPSCPIHPPHPLKTSIFPPAATCPPECSYASCTDPTRSTRINTFNSSDRSMLSLLPFGVVVVRMNYHGCTTSTANSLPPQYSAASLVNASRPVFANPTFSSAFRLPDSTSLTIDAVCSQIAQTIHPDDWRTISTTLFPFHPSASSTEMPPPSLSSLPLPPPNPTSFPTASSNPTIPTIFVHIVKIDDSTKSSSADPPVHHPTSNHHNQHPFKPPSSLSSTLPATLPETMSLHDLTDMICHEIRNPLAGISGNLELLRHGLEQRRAVLARALGLKSDPSPTPPMQHLHALHRDDEECVEAIQVCSKHAGRIVSDVQNLGGVLKAFSAPAKSAYLHAHDGETQRSGMAHGLFDPRTVVGEVARMMRARARIAGVGLRTCFPLDRVELWGDAQRVRQVVVNLVLNAVGHTASGGTITVGVEPMSAKESREEERSGEDEMRAKHMAVIRRRLGMKPVAVQGAAPPPFRERGERRDVVAKDSLGGSATQVIKIYVTDTGTGMTPEECDKLFKRFSQPIKKNQKEGVVVDEGFGLGLQISRRLVESMGGRMGVQSVKGRGSTFFFLLGGRPINPDDADGGITLSTPATVESHTRPVPLSRRARTLTHDESVLSSTKAVACVPLRRARSVSADGEGCVPLNVDPFPVIPPSNGGGIMMTTDVAWDTPPPTPRNGPVMGERMRTLSGTMVENAMSCEETREEESGEVLKKGRLPKASMIVEDNPIK
ncbi:hypothetical protein BC829DRAFT_379296 [Chytridium lagenaria]|nr:hypothetical protein BC829DRAFT_379296 [Chytridium lagenaria]